MTHEAGALHSPGYGDTAIVPSWLRPQDDVNDLLPAVWSRGVRRGADGAVSIAGVGVRALAQEFGTPLYALDEYDFRSRATAFRDAFTQQFAAVGGAGVYYAAKAFVCTEVARWMNDDGLGIDVCTGGELAVALRGGIPGERIAFHGNNKSDSEIHRALSAGVGRIVLDSLEEVDRVAAVAAELDVIAPVMLRVTSGVEAHTHEYIATSHEDQKFGLSISSGAAAQAARLAIGNPRLKPLGLHSHIGSQIFDTGGFEVAARRIIALHAQLQQEHDIELPELGLGGGFGIAYTSEHDPLEPEVLAKSLASIVAGECDDRDITPPMVSVEPGRAIAGPSTCTIYEVGTIKDIPLGSHQSRRYVAVDGGMSDNIRTALYNADFSCALVSRSSDAQPVLVRVVGKHCESGDIVVRDEFLPGDVHRGDLIAVPGTGAYCRSMAMQYNHVPRPPVVAIRDGQARVIVRREIEEDLLALDVVE